MKFSISSAVLISASASTVLGDAEFINGNWYGSAVDSITYTHWGQPGTYQKVTDMTGGKCLKTPVSYAGGMSPLDGEVSFHFRGPMHLKQFAFYTPGSSTSKRNIRPTTQQKRHNHGHGHVHRERGVDDWVTATINGQVVSWAKDYTSASTSAPTTSTSTPSTLNNPAISFSPTPNSNSNSGTTANAGAGTWSRQAYYNASTSQADGLVFLNNNGGQGSGTFDYKLGNSLSYASSSGTSGSSSPQVLSDTLLPDNTEVILYTDRPCLPTDSIPCDPSRPGTVAYHGFSSPDPNPTTQNSKLFLLEFSMPHSNLTSSSAPSGSFNFDMPAIWILNAAIPRTQQYGPCSCWPNCGEWDILEILDSGNDRAKSTLHAGVSGGESDYFERPTEGTMKVAVLFDGGRSEGHIVVLGHDVKFDVGIADKVVAGFGTGGAGGAGSGGNAGEEELEGVLRSTVFKLGGS